MAFRPPPAIRVFRIDRSLDQPADESRQFGDRIESLDELLGPYTTRALSMPQARSVFQLIWSPAEIILVAKNMS